MYWTEEHDRLMCREILAVDPFTGTKKGTVQRGAEWKIIADHLLEILEPKFKVDSRAVRDRYQLLAHKLRKKLKSEEKVSGIDTEMSETETAIEELIEKEDAAESMDGDDTQRQRERKKQDKERAEDMRRQAMERMGQTQKRRSVEGENETKEKKGQMEVILCFICENEMSFFKKPVKRSLLFENRNLCCKRKIRKI